MDPNKGSAAGHPCCGCGTEECCAPTLRGCGRKDCSNANLCGCGSKDCAAPTRYGCGSKGVLASSKSGPTPVVTCPESQSVSEVSSIDCTGDVERPRETGLSDLPDDLVAVILENLSLHELARVSRTCSTFQAVCRREIGQEQQTRCDRAVGCVGRERLISLSLIIDRFLKEGPLGLEVAGKGKCADRVPVDEVNGFDGFSDHTYKVGDTVVEVELGGFGSLWIKLPTLEGKLLHLIVEQYDPDSFALAIIGGTKVALDLMEGTAILETLLSGDLAPHFPEPGLPSGVCPGRWLVPQIIESVLAPCVVRRTFAAVGLGGARFRHERGRVSQQAWYTEVGMLRYSTKKLVSLTLSVDSMPDKKMSWFTRFFVWLEEVCFQWSMTYLNNGRYQGDLDDLFD